MVERHMSSSESIRPGLHVLYGNRPEGLRDLLVEHIQLHPLDPLESETILVQSNGIAHWLKLAAAHHGIAMGLEITLPARLQWRIYRSMPGAESVPRVSPFDTDRLVWRILRILPDLLKWDHFAPLARYLSDPQDIRRRYQLAERIADLFDQYQVYRADWLSAWKEGKESGPDPFPAEQRWQPLLWRSLCEDMPEPLRNTDRAEIHRRCIRYLGEAQGRPEMVPPRVSVFGVSSLPTQMIEVLHAISRFSRVMIYVHNPSDHRWNRNPEASRNDASGSPAHPLLAAWGRQGSDYITALESLGVRDTPFDESAPGRSPRHPIPAPHYSSHFQSFGEDTLLHQLQEDIREFRSPTVHSVKRYVRYNTDSPSIQFHVAHSALREVEILHDRLLDAFNRDPSLRPRDVMVMVPDIGKYAPLISAVFGQVDRSDLRYIPFTVSDQGLRNTSPLVTTWETILGLSNSRFTVEDVLGLVRLPALRRRFGIREADLETINRWVDDAGIRWGLDSDQRRQFDLPDGLDHNTWRFGLRRMLLGYATGTEEVWQEIVGYGGISGQDSALLGSLDTLIAVLDRYRVLFSRNRSPEEWTSLITSAMEDFYQPEGDEEQQPLESLRSVLRSWQESCDEADFTDGLPVTVVRDVLLGRLDAPRLTQRYLAGAVNFATLMPMRAIPFRMICLLGMNDGDYPRTVTPPGFDLMQGPEGYRPGDRSRREDDRYLFLEAILSARHSLYVSWVGRDIRDNSVRPPSVLVGRLRDHLDATWNVASPVEAPTEASTETPTEASTITGGTVSDLLTIHHPLQPFSSRYFEPGVSLFTYAHEWRARRGSTPASPAPERSVSFGEPRELSLRDLTELLRNPTRIYFQETLHVRFPDVETEVSRSESFTLDGLERWHLKSDLLRAMIEETDSSSEEPLRRHLLSGNLPPKPFDRIVCEEMLGETVPVYDRYREEMSGIGAAKEERIVVEVADKHNRVVLRDQISDLLLSREGTGKRVFAAVSAVHDGRSSYRWEKLLPYWAGHLAANLGERPVMTTVVALHGNVTLPPILAEQARAILLDLLEAWSEALNRPFRTVPRAAFAWLNSGGVSNPDEAATKARSALIGNQYQPGEFQWNGYLSRAWRDVDAVLASDLFARETDLLYRSLYEILGTEILGTEDTS